jgi:hypothetical protein
MKAARASSLSHSQRSSSAVCSTTDPTAARPTSSTTTVPLGDTVPLIVYSTAPTWKERAKVLLLR